MNNLQVEIISITGSLFSGKCQMVVLPTLSGEVGIMQNHESIISLLTEGEIKIYFSENNLENSFKITGGFAEIENHNKLLVLIDQ
jgi:F-type H+-transporting ATPase subunit epsilon